MIRKAAKKAKPKPRGLQGGRKAKYIRPGEGVEMTKMTFRIRTDIAEQIVDTAAAEGMSKDEWLMRKVSPQWMATLDAWHASQRRSQEAENVAGPASKAGKKPSPSFSAAPRLTTSPPPPAPVTNAAPSPRSKPTAAATRRQKSQLTPA